MFMGPPQGLQHLRSALVAIFGFVSGGLSRDLKQSGREVHEQLGLQLRRKKVKRLLARHQGVEGGPQGVEVRPGIHRGSIGALFRCHERQSPHHGAGSGELDVFSLELGDAKVRHLGIPVLREQDVSGFDVPVHNSSLVGHRKCFKPWRCQGAQGIEAVTQAPPPDLFHDHVDPVAILPHVQHHHDVWVGQLGHGAGFPLKSLSHLGVGCQLGGEHLDRAGHVQIGVISPVYRGHPADPQHFHEPVAAR